MSMDHDRHQENIGAYLLGALPELESELFERHIMGCPGCREEVERLRMAADALPRSVEPMNPPAELKASLMRVVSEEAAERSPEKRRRRARFGLGFPDIMRVPAAAAWASAAVLLAIGVLGGWGVAQLGQGSSERTVAASVDQVRLPDGTASLTVRDDGEGGGVLSVQGLPQPADDQVYQVWLVKGGDVTPSTLFTVRSDGSGAAAIPEDLQGVEKVMVTREPKGGAASPSERPVIVADWAV